MAIISILFAVALYFLPSIIGGKKRNANAIFTLNLLLGWSIIGWIVSLVWALTNDPEAAPVAPAAATARPTKTVSGLATQLGQLHELRKQGVLSEPEYEAAKQRALAERG